MHNNNKPSSANNYVANSSLIIQQRWHLHIFNVINKRFYLSYPKAEALYIKKKTGFYDQTDRQTNIHLDIFITDLHITKTKNYIIKVSLRCTLQWFSSCF